MAHNIYILVSFMDVMFDSFIIHWFDYTKAIMYPLFVQITVQTYLPDRKET